MLSEFVIIAIPLAFVAVLVVYVYVLERRIDKLVRGSDGASLESTLTATSDRLATIQKENSEIVTYVRQLDTRFKSSIQQVALLRFNPFDDTGGDNSFALALLDEKGDGIVVSSLYARDRTSIFAKPVAGYASPHHLSKEETTVIADARASEK